MPTPSPNPSLTSKLTDNNLIHLIYEASTNPELWTIVLSRVQERLRATCGVVYDLTSANRPTMVNAIQGYSDQTIQAFHTHFGARDLRAALLNPTAPAGYVYADNRDILFAQLENSEIQADFYRPNGVGHIAAAILARTPERFSVMSIHRDRHAGAFAPEDLALLDLLAPHLVRAWSIGAKLRDYADTASTLLHALDRQSGTVFIVRPDATFCGMTPSAEAVLRREEGLRARANRLEATWPQDESALKATIRSLGPAKTAAIVRLRRPSDMRPTTLFLAYAHADPFGTSARILIFFNQPHLAPTLSPAILASQFALSAAESRIAAALANGLNTEEMAERFRLSRETIRSHLKSAMAKCSVRSQAELVGLVNRSLGNFT